MICHLIDEKDLIGYTLYLGYEWLSHKEINSESLYQFMLHGWLIDLAFCYGLVALNIYLCHQFWEETMYSVMPQ